MNKTGAVVIAIALLSGCSTRGNLTQHELAVLKRDKAVLEVQANRCHNFDFYAANELRRAQDEDQAACTAKCPGNATAQFFSAIPSDDCKEKFPECKSPIFDAVNKRLDDENPSAQAAPTSVLGDGIDKVEPDDVQPPDTRCNYLDDKIRELDSHIYYGDPTNCVGPCWMTN